MGTIRLHPALALDRPQVFAHRGGAALRPENTLVAFDHALALGVDGLELDVHLSRDGVVVVHHDPTLDRTTDAAGSVATRTVAQLALVDAAYWFDPKEGYPFRGRRIGVPTLRQVLRRFPGVSLIVEIKGHTPELPERTVEEIRAASAVERVLVGGYRRGALCAVRRLEPRLLTGAAREEARWALYRSWIRWPLGRVPFRAFQVPEYSGRMHIVTPRFIQAAHVAGAAVQVWTVDRAEDIRRLVDWGVDGFITDRPDVAVPLVREIAAEARRAAGLPTRTDR